MKKVSFIKYYFTGGYERINLQTYLFNLLTRLLKAQLSLVFLTEGKTELKRNINPFPLNCPGSTWLCSVSGDGGQVCATEEIYFVKNGIEAWPLLALLKRSLYAKSYKSTDWKSTDGLKCIIRYL